MRKSTIIGATGAAVVALAGCSAGQQPADLSPGPGLPPPPSAIAPAKNSSDGDETKNINTDLQFAQQMLTHHTVEKELVDVALRNTDEEPIVSLAERMESSGEEQIQKISAWLKSQGRSGVVPEDVGPGEDARMPEAGVALSRMEEAGQGQFAPLWIKTAITHHREVVEIAEIEIREGSSPELKAVAEEIVATHEAELAELKKLREEY